MQKLTLIVILQVIFVVMSSKRDVLNARNARRRAAYARDKANRERTIIESNPPLFHHPQHPFKPKWNAAVIMPIKQGDTE